MSHIPVLLHETIDSLEIKDGDVYVDCTLGAGGHISEVCKRFGKKVRLIGMDADKLALDRAETKLSTYACTAKLYKENFRNLDNVLEKSGIEKGDKFLFDLGTSSNQIEESGRGFSFMRDEPLLMTLDDSPTEETLTAYEIVNSWPEKELADLIFHYGEDRLSRRIAKAIVAFRKNEKITSSSQLADVIEEAIGRRGKIHPATRTFQALRIQVNEELSVLEEGLKQAWMHLNEEGRIAVITFHSLEDRIVKKYFQSLEKEGLAKNIFKKPLIPKREEIVENPRSRSAKLRVIKKNHE